MTPQPKEPAQDPRRIDFAVVREALRSGRAPNRWMASWLRDAYAEPQLFLAGLYAYVAKRRGGLKGALGKPVDFYQDVLACHLGSARRAFVSLERGKRVELSYEALYARSGALAGAWSASGVQAGQCIAICLPLGVDWVVALLAALRLGLVICSIPPCGPAFVEHRVAALAPDAIAIDPRAMTARLQSAQATFLPLAGGRESRAPASHSYAPDEPVLRVFPVFGCAELVPLDVAAGALHAALLCDAHVVLALDGSDTLAAPGFDALAAQPALVLSALMAGAAWAELSPTDPRETPGVLSELSVTLLGVLPNVRDALASRGLDEGSSLRAWFRSMTEPLDLEAWDDFARRAAARGLAAFNTAFSSAAPGALLFGPVLKEPLTLQVWPAPTRPWRLAEAAGRALKALNDVGILTPLAGDAELASVPRLLLAREGDGYVCSGSMDIGPGARAYPVEEVSAVVETHEAVRHATVVVSPGSRINTANLTLIAFVEDAHTASELASTPDVLSLLIEREMGAACVPTRIEVFPLRPRMRKGRLDHAWCRSQYLGGVLTQKSKREPFRLLGRLNYLLGAPAQDS